MFKVIATDTYIKEIGKWQKIDKESAEEIPKKIAENPFIGDQLGNPYLREKRVRGNKIYYLIYKEFNFVILVAASDKKDQTITLNFIKQHLNEFRKTAEELFKQHV